LLGKKIQEAIQYLTELNETKLDCGSGDPGKTRKIRALRASEFGSVQQPLLWLSLGLSCVIVLWQMCCYIAYFAHKLTSRVCASEEPLLPVGHDVEAATCLGTLKKHVLWQDLPSIASWQSCAFTLAALYIISWILVASQQRAVPLWAHFNSHQADVAVGTETTLIRALSNVQNKSQQTVDDFLSNFLPHLQLMLRHSQPFWEEGYCAAAVQINAV